VRDRLRQPPRYILDASSNNQVSQSALDQAVQTINDRGFVGKVQAKIGCSLPKAQFLSNMDCSIEAKVASVRGNGGAMSR